MSLYPVRLMILSALLAATACTSSLKAPTQAPLAEQRLQKLEKHGDVRQDPYFWLKHRESGDVLDYLKQENAYTETALAPMKRLREKLFEEMKGRIKKNDSTVPVKIDDYHYYAKYEENSEYPIAARKKSSLEAKEEAILDANELAKGQSFFSLGHWQVSPNHRYLAYTTDTVGRRLYNLYVKDLETGTTAGPIVEKTTSNFVWANDNETLFYTQQHPETLRHDKIFAYHMPTKKTRLVYHEKDEKFYTGVSRSKNDKYIFIGSGSSETSEWRFFRADRPQSIPKVFQKRQYKHEYSIEHIGQGFLVISNDKARNFKVMRTPNDTLTEKRHWKTVIPHRDDVLVEGVSVFKDRYAFAVRTGGVSEIEIMERASGKRFLLPQPEKSHVTGLSANVDYDADFLRYSYESMTQPEQIIDYRFADGHKEIRKVQEVLGGFDAKNYVSERVSAKASDGVEIPISIVYHKKFKRDGTRPLLLYGYGSYGMSMDPWFSEHRLSLLDRGFGFAIAHIRGGSEMGRHWYENGKRLHKKNTFTDFIAAGEYLVANKYVHPGKLYAMGGSAGGLLMGAVINMRPDLFRGVVAQVPFVDVVTTMLDDTIPLTTNEYEEWGNPNDKQYYHYMKSYSPYDNVTAQAYPNLLVTAGLHDDAVQYWEPAKWVAKLRRTKTDGNLLLLTTDMEAGHGGKSGRFKSIEDRARDYGFILYLEGITR